MQIDELIEQLEGLKNQKKRHYTFSINKTLHEKLEKLVHLCRATINSDQTKQAWVREAIKEKLSLENINEDIPKERRISLKIEEDLLKQIEERVEILKNYLTSYSKRLWIIDAIYEKMDRDEKELIQRLKRKLADN